MKVVCAWCEKEGKPAAEALIGEREPLADERTSHGICPDHRHEIEERVNRLRDEARRQKELAERQRAEAEQQRAAAEAQSAEAEELRRKVDP